MAFNIFDYNNALSGKVAGPAFTGNSAIDKALNQNLPARPVGQVLGASTGPSYSAPVPAPQPSLLDQISANTRNVYGDQLNAERSAFDQRSAALNNQLEGLGREKDSLLDRIGSTYRGLMQTAQDTLQKNLGALDVRKGEVNQEYDTSRTNVARLLGDQQRQNRIMARAQNLLSSGYYTNLQSQAGRDATTRVAGLNTEETSKLDAIGNAILGAQTDTNTKLQALKEEQANQEAETINKYTTLANQIRSDLSFNEKDKLDAIRAVNNRLTSALDNIGLTFGQYAATAANLGSSAATRQAQIQSYNPFAAIQPTLDTGNALSAASAGFDGGITAPAGNQSYLSSIFGQYDPERRPRSFLDLIG